MMKKRLFIVNLVMFALTVSMFSLSAAALTGDEILLQLDQQDQFLSEGSMISTLQFNTAYSDGTTSANQFASLSKNGDDNAEYSLIYFVEPIDVAGTIFLSVKTSLEESAHMWLFLPALGGVKELVADQQEQSFAGSAFSYQDIGSRDFQGEYNAETVGEEQVEVDGKSYDCYILNLTAREDSNAEYASGKMWVEKENFIMLKSEDYNNDGKLERTTVILKLGEFEGNVVADKMISTDTIGGSSTTITFLTRTRPGEDIPNSVFDADDLAAFDPGAYGL